MNVNRYTHISFLNSLFSLRSLFLNSYIVQFELRYEDGEYIISFEGTTDKDGYISSLIFNTSMDRSSDEFGKAVANNEFFLKPRGFHKLVGFRGRSCVDRINALGANFAVVLAPPVKKLQAQGTNDQGEEWDDGVHDNVRMITVTYVYDCVVSVTFEYANGAETVLGDPHGILDDRHEKKEVSALVSKLIALYIYMMHA